MFKSFQYLAVMAVAAFISFSAAAQAEPVAVGTFVGASKHVTTGGVEIVRNADNSYTVILGEDFSLDGAPDPRVGFGKSGNYDGNTELGKLAQLTGTQSYIVPASVDIASYDQVYIWCEKFSVPLGIAQLN
jgi:electron transfer DM13